MRPGTDITENSLRHLLNQWDPIGVADEVQDEYDCMLAPLLQRLRGGADQAEVCAFLRHELEDHFGLDPLGPGPDAMAGRVVAWWTTADPGLAPRRATDRPDTTSTRIRETGDS